MALTTASTLKSFRPTFSFWGRLKDRDLNAIKEQSESESKQQEKALERQSQLERALRDHEKENFQLKQLVNSGSKPQESKKALASAAHEIKSLKVEKQSVIKKRQD